MSLNKKTIFVNYIIALIIITILAGLGFIFYQRQTVKKTAQAVEMQQPSKQTQQNKKQNETIAGREQQDKPLDIKEGQDNENMDWNIYTNKEIGFEIKYPNDWTYGAGYLSFKNNLSVEFCSLTDYAAVDPKNPQLGCQHYEPTENTGPKTQATIHLFISNGEEIPQQTNVESENKKINNIDFVIRRWEERNLAFAYWHQGNYFFSLDTDGEGTQYFDKMISTFKFLK